MLLAAVRVADQEFGQAILAEHLAVFVFRLGDAVGEEDQQIAGAELDVALAVLGEIGNAPTTVPLTSSSSAAPSRISSGGRWPALV